MMYSWSLESKKYIDDMLKNFQKGIEDGILDSMVFAEEQAKGIFIEGQNADKKPPIPPPLPPPGPLTSRSGRLRTSIESGARKNTGWLKTNTPYGIIHEVYGVNEQGNIIGKRPFLMPSFEGNNLGKIKETIIKGIFLEMS